MPQKTKRKPILITFPVWISCVILLLNVVSCKKDDSEEESTGSSCYALPSSIQWVNVPGGTFTMGGTTTVGDAPEVDVSISSFEISTKEITNAEYVSFLNSAIIEGWISVATESVVDPCGSYSEKVIRGAGSAPYAGEIYLQLGETGGCTSDGHAEDLNNKSWIQFDATSNSFSLIDADKGDWPVNWVRWYGANAFCEFFGVHLPSEAQWEYAARGGKQYEYPTDNGTLDASKANYNGDTPGVLDPDGHAFATGSYAANPFGIYDMGGNVWEWCSDYYDANFYTSGKTDPINTTAGPDNKRVRRGGSWNYHSATLLTYARASDLPERGNNHFGFRVVK